MKIVLFTILGLFSVNTLASTTTQLKFSLACRAYQYSEYKEGELQKELPVSHPEAKEYKLVKVVSKVVNPQPGQNKWQTNYQIEVLLSDASVVVIPLMHGGSGDEDYNEFAIETGFEALAEKFWLHAGSINNYFKWASFEGLDLNSESVFYFCEK